MESGQLWTLETLPTEIRQHIIALRIRPHQQYHYQKARKAYREEWKLSMITASLNDALNLSLASPILAGDVSYLIGKLNEPLQVVPGDGSPIETVGDDDIADSIDHERGHRSKKPFLSLYYSASFYKVSYRRLLRMIDHISVVREKIAVGERPVLSPDPTTKGRKRKSIREHETGRAKMIAVVSALRSDKPDDSKETLEQEDN